MIKTLIFKTYFYPIFLCILVMVQFVLMIHGFDVNDEGFSLTFYQQFFNAPQSVEYCFVYWLSGLVGGLWYLLFEDGGILWFRVLTIVFNTATFMMCYSILKPHMSRAYILLGLTMVLFVNDFGFLAFYHNHLTAFLAILSVYVLIEGLHKTNLWLLGFSGLILGVNIFSRLPNITLLIFVLVIPYGYIILRKKHVKTCITPIVTMLLGVVLGIMLVIGLMKSLHQWEIMENAFKVLFSLGKTDDSGHNIITLIRVIKNNYVAIVYEGCKLMLLIFTLLGLYKILKYNKIRKVVVPMIALILFVVLFAKGDIYIIYVFGLLGCLGVLLTTQKTEGIKMIAFLALLIMIFLPLGSGGGVHSSGYICIWLAIPFFFQFLSQIMTVRMSTEIASKTYTCSIDNQLVKPLFVIIAMSYFGYKGYSMSQQAYFDKGNRLVKTATINNKFAKGIYTTRERADIINDVLQELEKHVQPDDYLFVYDSAPMLHFLTQTRPYPYNPWVWIYDHVSFEAKIYTAENEIEVLPIVVQQKFTTIWEFSEPMDDYLAENRQMSNTYHPGRAIAMNQFLDRHDYKIIWSNAHFNIYKSKIDLATK
ncbi:MAG: hypothetical protein WA775_03980 [Psychroserpens sp.]|uniref:hypothetical protein n=1 Tax=Psychroserpens sp. TaxID=2020870 RepID=UPI003C8EEFF3